jgi:hypothetical protein
MIPVDWVLGVPLLLHQTAETQYSQPSLLVEVEVADRGNLVLLHQWTTEELVVEPDHQVVADQTQETALIAASVIMAVGALMVKDILVDQVLDLMQIQKIRIKVVAVVAQVVQEPVLRTDVNDIVRPLEEIKLLEDQAVQQIY